jgi:hypothetical protein
LPRAGRDRISCPESALMTIALAIHRPLRPETISLLLDAERRGLGVGIVSGTRRPDDVLDVVEYFSRPSAHGGRMGAMVVASVRPGGRDDAVQAGDIDRWLEMSDLAEQSGVELLEWFVVADEVSCPRDRLGEAPRW